MSLCLQEAGLHPASLSLPDARSHRVRLVTECVSRWCRQWYSAAGCWVAASPPPDTRKSLWLCFGLLAGNEHDQALALAILRQLPFELHGEARTEEEAAAGFDIFSTNHAMQMLVSFSSRLDSQTRKKLEDWSRAALGDYPGDRQVDYQFHGFNDNMPAKATLGLVLGGEYFGDTAAVEHGVWLLQQLAAQLTRRGLISEYTSPTYLPLTLANLSEVACHARHPLARQLARQCCKRIWADVLGHFHTPTGMMGGPYSRAYQLDSTGHFSSMACLLWLTLGDRIPFHPVEEIDREPMRLVHHHANRPTQLGILGWMASVPLEPPPDLLVWLEKRTHPFRLLASAERGGANGGEVATTFYAEEDFALGTAEFEGWTELQSEAFFLQYRTRSPMRGIEDLRTVYARYLTGQMPGDGEQDHCLKPCGPVHTVQKDRMALVLAHPSPDLEGKPLPMLKFSAILPVHFRQPGHITQRCGHVFLQDGSIHLALRPLNATLWSKENPACIEEAGHYCMISFFNYQGAPRVFSLEELGRTLNGFVSVVGLAREESFEAFQSRVLEAEVLDYFYFGSRTVSVRLGGDHLAMSYHTASNRVRYASINGQSPAKPRWKADGLSEGDLPFLDGHSSIGPERPFPYQHLNVIWGNEPWALASRPGKPQGGVFSPDGWSI